MNPFGVLFNDFEIVDEPKTKRLFAGRTLHKFRTAEGALPCCSMEEYCPHDRDAVGEPSNADLVSSILPGTTRHMPVIDLDLPCKLVESGTPGHYHLYIDREVPWVDYVNLLRALAQAGLVQPGYVEASVSRGYSSVRVPWKPKGVVG